MIDSVFCLLFPLVRTASVSEIGFEKINNSQLFKNLNDAYIILMPMFATCK